MAARAPALNSAARIAVSIVRPPARLYPCGKTNRNKSFARVPFRHCMRTATRAHAPARPPGVSLAFRLAAAGGFGVVDRAEPARALADVHMDLGVPTAGGPMINTFAGAVDVALDGALRRRRDRARCRCQQDRAGV